MCFPRRTSKSQESQLLFLFPSSWRQMGDEDMALNQEGDIWKVLETF